MTRESRQAYSGTRLAVMSYVIEAGCIDSIIGITAGIILLRRRETQRFTDNQLLVLMALMVSDFCPTYTYYVTEIYNGLPNVGGLTDLIVKFNVANSFWLVMPWVVFIWAGRQLIGRRAS